MAKKILVLGSNGFVRNQFSLTAEKLLQAAGQNTGNFIFQHAVCKLIDEKLLQPCEVEYPRYWEDLFDSDYDASIMPAANHLRPDADWTEFNKFLDKIKSPLLVLGLGAQADINDNFESTIIKLKQNKTVIRFCEILNEKAVFVGLRGHFSQKVAEGMGLRNTAVTGCPSLLISSSRNLGHKLRIGLQNCVELLQSGSSCIFGHNAEHFNYLRDNKNQAALEIERFLFEECRSRASYYIQQSGGIYQIYQAVGGELETNHPSVHAISKLIAPDKDVGEISRFLEKRGLVFFSALDWMEFCKRLDFTIGLRIHGAMASLGSDVPSVVIAHDSRTSEMADFMEIPRLRVEFCNKFNLLEMLKNVEFYPEKLDAARKQAAHSIFNAFLNYGIPASDHLKSFCL